MTSRSGNYFFMAPALPSPSRATTSSTPRLKSSPSSSRKRTSWLPDGIVGNATFGAAMLQGFEAVPFVDEPAAKYPLKPDFEPIVGNAARNALFGPLKFRPGPLNRRQGKETITVTNDFESDSILRTEIPELIGIKGASSTGRVRFHKTCVPQLKGLWAAWRRKGLLKHILTYDGAYTLTLHSLQQQDTKQPCLWNRLRHQRRREPPRRSAGPYWKKRLRFRFGSHGASIRILLGRTFFTPRRDAFRDRQASIPG